MNDPYDVNQPQPNPEPPPPAETQPPAAFCQHCGKPLTPETIRRVGTAVYCEPCLAARIGQAPGYTPVNAGPFATSNLGTPGPNPGLAALLGLIPGVGAFYNEQYAKGVVHVIVFMVLISLADNVNGIFAFLVAGWIFYMAIEAHHTARARRDGTPLPNPFGLNDIGERLGFGKAWPAGPSVAEVANDAAAAAAAAAARASATYPPQPAQPWGSPTDAYTQPPPYNQAAYSQPFVDAAYAKAYQDMGYGQYPGPQPGSQTGSQPGTGPGTQLPPHPPTYTPYTAVPPYNPGAPYDPAAYPTPPPSNRFPAGAVALIGLGTIFLLATTGLFNSFNFRPEAILGAVLLGVAAWVFLARMTSNGKPLTSDHTPAYSLRLLNALMVTLWIALLGLLFLLDGLNILAWHHSWPFLIILPGVLALLRRAFDQTLASSYVPPAAPPSSPNPAPGSTQGGL
jgi:hypothetical protein